MARIGEIQDSGEYLFRAYEIVAPYVEGDQKFWFEQAAIINRQANGIPPDPESNQSATFILTFTDYGLAVDGIPADLRTTSNTIATNVLDSILDQGGVPALTNMLSADIYAALDVSQQTIGGWGGSFMGRTTPPYASSDKSRWNNCAAHNAK